MQVHLHVKKKGKDHNSQWNKSSRCSTQRSLLLVLLYATLLCKGRPRRSHQHSVQRVVGRLRVRSVAAGPVVMLWHARLGYASLWAPEAKLPWGMSLQRPSAWVPSTLDRCTGLTLSAQKSVWEAEGASQPHWEVHGAADRLCFCGNLFITDCRHLFGHSLHYGPFIRRKNGCLFHLGLQDFNRTQLAPSENPPAQDHQFQTIPSLENCSFSWISQN